MKNHLGIAEKSFDSLIKNLVIEYEDGNIVLENTCGACGLGGNPYREGDYNYYLYMRTLLILRHKLIIPETYALSDFIIIYLNLLYRKVFFANYTING